MHRRIRGRAALVALLIAASLPLTATASFAHEAGSPTPCSSGALCVWWDAHYGGSRYQFFGTNSSWHSWAIADDDSSSRNNGTSGLRARIFEHTGYGGARIVCLAMGDRAAHHSPNDRGSSNDWQSFC